MCTPHPPMVALVVPPHRGAVTHTSLCASSLNTIHACALSRTRLRAYGCIVGIQRMLTGTRTHSRVLTVASVAYPWALMRIGCTP